MKSDNFSNDAIVQIFTRNEFYKKKFYLTAGVFLLCLMVISLLSCILYYLYTNPSKPLYFVTDDAGRFVQEIPKQQPNMSLESVTAWVKEAVESAYSYDHVNFRSQFQHTQKYFTTWGWKNYMQGMKASNNLIALSQRKMIAVGKVVETPKLVTSGILGGAYAWKFQMPVLMTYLQPPYNDASRIQNSLIVTVVVQRQDVLSSYKGLGIIQFIGALQQ